MDVCREAVLARVNPRMCRAVQEVAAVQFMNEDDVQFALHPEGVRRISRAIFSPSQVAVVAVQNMKDEARASAHYRAA